MKIAVFHNVPSGGAKRVIYEQVKYLSKEHQLTLNNYSSTNEEFLNITSFVEAVNKYEFTLKDFHSGFYKRLIRDYRNFVQLDRLNRQIARNIDKGGYDVVLVHPDMYTQAPFLLKHLTTPCLYYCEEYLRLVYEDQFKFDDSGNPVKSTYERLTRYIRKVIDRKNAASADLLVANSRFTKRNIENAYVKSAKYCLLGVDTNVFKPSGEEKDNTLIFLGNKEDGKGYRLMENILTVVKKEFEVNIEIVNMYGKKGKPISDKELVRRYSKALGLLCTHQNEPFGLPPLESMACETPVLAVNEGGYKETVVDGVTGFLLPRDPGAFAEKIKYFLDNPKVTKKMGEAGREHVKKNFTWKKHNKKIEKLLKETARKKK